MPKQILVRVRNISRDEQGRETELFGIKSVITYKAFLYTREQFEIIEQVEENGVDPETKETIYKAVPGNPNLHAEFRKEAPKSAVHADELGEQKPTKGRGRPRSEPQLKEEIA
jgi:hypothetical protein